MTEPVVQEATPMNPDDMGPDDSAPFGYMIDPGSGERRPKKRPGKQPGARVGARKSPPIEELRTGAAPTEPAAEDRTPGRLDGRRRRRGRMAARPKAEPEPLPPFRAGPIAKGMNGLYARAGRILRVLDADVGQAVIASTRKESDDDTTVGEAWEELARTNDGVRRLLLKLISGGAVGQLLYAHLPIVLAIVMKDRIRRRLPFQKLVEAVLVDDDQAGGSEAGPSSADLQQMLDLANQLMGQQMNPNGVRTPTVDPATP